MKPIGDVRKAKKEITNDILVGEMEDNSLVISYNGEEQTVPILGVFTVDSKHYVTLLAQESGKEVVVIYNVVTHNGKEHIQVITSQEEWDKVNTAWGLIVDASASKI